MPDDTAKAATEEINDPEDFVVTIMGVSFVPLSVHVALKRRLAAERAKREQAEAELSTLDELLKDHQGESRIDRVKTCIETANDVVKDARLLYDMEEYPGQVELVQRSREAEAANAKMREALEAVDSHYVLEREVQDKVTAALASAMRE